MGKAEDDKGVCQSKMGQDGRTERTDHTSTIFPFSSDNPLCWVSECRVLCMKCVLVLNVFDCLCVYNILVASQRLCYLILEKEKDGGDRGEGGGRDGQL